MVLDAVGLMDGMEWWEPYCGCRPSTYWRAETPAEIKVSKPRFRPRDEITSELCRGQCAVAQHSARRNKMVAWRRDRAERVQLYTVYYARLLPCTREACWTERMVHIAASGVSDRRHARDEKKNSRPIAQAKSGERIGRELFSRPLMHRARMQARVNHPRWATLASTNISSFPHAGLFDFELL